MHQTRGATSACTLSHARLYRPHQRLQVASRRRSSMQHTQAETSNQVLTLEKGSTVLSVCRMLDSILADTSDGSTAEQKAVALMDAAMAQGVFKAFGGGLQVPKRIYTIEELRLNKIEPERLLSPTDDSLNLVRNIAQAAAAVGLVALGYFSGFDGGKVFGTLTIATFLLVVDQVANMGGGEALLLDSLGRILTPSYHKRVTLHEAGHFLVAYLVGLLPKDYTLSSLDAFASLLWIADEAGQWCSIISLKQYRYRALNVQAGCNFCDGGFEGELAAGRVSSTSLDKFACVAVAGVVTEYLRFGQAEGGLGDISQLDRLLRALQFTQKKADGQVRWAVLNVAALLRRHAALHDELAAAMDAGKSVGSCIALLEAQLSMEDHLLAPSSSVQSSGSSSGSMSAQQ